LGDGDKQEWNGSLLFLHRELIGGLFGKKSHECGIAGDTFPTYFYFEKIPVANVYGQRKSK